MLFLLRGCDHECTCFSHVKLDFAEQLHRENDEKRLTESENRPEPSKASNAEEYLLYEIIGKYGTAKAFRFIDVVESIQKSITFYLCEEENLAIYQIA